MANYYSQLWTGTEFARQQTISTKQPRLLHAVSRDFGRRGVTQGDTLYVWSFMKGKLFLIGRMVVDEIASSVKAADRLGRPELTDSKEHALARECTTKMFDIEVPPDMIRELRFIGASGELAAPKRRSDGEVDPQTFRGVRKLSASSARLLDGLLPS